MLRSPLTTAILIALAGCRHPTSLDGNWGIPPQEGSGVALSQEVVLLSDNQIQHLYGEPVWLRSGFTNRLISVAIRAVQLDFYAPDMLEWIARNFGDRHLLIHLGDALNVACRAEWEIFVDRMSGHSYVLFLAFRVRETKVDKLGLVFFDKAEYRLGLHLSIPPTIMRKNRPAVPGPLAS